MCRIPLTISLNWKWLKHVYFKPLNLPKGSCRVSQVSTPAYTEQGLLVFDSDLGAVG